MKNLTKSFRISSHELPVLENIEILSNLNFLFLLCGKSYRDEYDEREVFEVVAW